MPLKDLAGLPNSSLCTLIIDGQQPIVCRLGDLRKRLGAEHDQVISTGDAARIWPAFSQETWRKRASEGQIPGAWQDAPGGPWRLPYGSCRQYIAEKQRRGLRRGKTGPRGPWKNQRRK